MNFRVSAKERGNQPKVNKKDYEIARQFAKRVYNEFGTFISALVLFGSVAYKKEKPGDIDVMIVVDDVRVNLSSEILETYRVIVEKAIINTSPKIHVQTMKLSTFWEYMRAGDPVAINILRTGIALIDTGFFDPLQALLDSGRIRPTKESIQTYFSMAYSSLSSARSHLLGAVLDLYWAVINSAHSALMRIGEIPPSPEEVADKVKERFYKTKKIKLKHVNFVRRIYTFSRNILNKRIVEVDAGEYEKLKKETEEFVKLMKKIIEKGD